MDKSNLKRSMIKVMYGLRLGKPKLLLKVSRSIIKGKLFKQIPLKYLDIAIDYRCNFKCAHCFAQNFVEDNKDKKVMELEDYKKLYEEASKLGAFDFNFQGGEPLMFMDRLEKIIQIFKPSENFIAVTTNGYLLDEKNIKRLKKNKVDLIVVSLDSGIPEEHDKFRKKPGSFKKATQGIELAIKHGLKVGVNTALWHGNVKSKGIQDLIDYVEKKKIFLNPIFAAPVGNWENNKSVILSDGDVKYVDQLMKKYWFMRRDVQSNLISPGCGAVKESIYVTAHGEILGCPFIHASFGNIKNTPLKTIRNNGLKTKYFGKYWPKCLISEDMEFMKHYLKTVKGKKLPISYKKFKDKWE